MNTALYAPNTGLLVEANVDPTTIQALGGASWPRLFFQATLNIREETGEHWRGRVQAVAFGMVTGGLVIGTELVANIQPISLNKRRPGDLGYPMEERLSVEIELDNRRIEWLDRLRSGGALEAKFRLNVQTQVFGRTSDKSDFPFGLVDATSIYGEIPFAIPEARWRERVLPGLGYGKVMVVELPTFSLESCEALDHSFKALEKAQRHFSLGLYDDAVASCRVALDPFFEQVEKGDGSGKTVPILKKSWETRLGAETHRWLDSALSAIKTAANKPHHTPHNHFDRFEAQMLQMITTALVAYAARHVDAKPTS